MVRGVGRVRIGTGTTGPGAALWVEGTVVDDRRPPVERRRSELAKEYKALATTLLQQARRLAGRRPVSRSTTRRSLADNSGYAPYLTTDQKVELLETADPVDAAASCRSSWPRDHLAELDVAETIRKDVQEGMEKQQREFLLRQQLAAVRKELARAERRRRRAEEEDYRARVEAADLPEKVREAALKEVDKLERTSDAVPRGRLDPHLARHRPRAAVERADRGQLRHRAAPAPCWTPTTPAWTT